LIINKRRCLGALLLTAVFLVSCGTGELPDIPLEPLEGALPNTETPESYYVTVASDCSADTWELAETLAFAIQEKTGVETRRLHIHEDAFREEGSIFIYLGMIPEFTEGRVFMKDLRRYDYLCRWVGGRLLLGGRTDEATRAAVERFCKEILPLASDASLMGKDGGFLYRSDQYGVGSVSLNGFALSEYRLVYPTDASDAMRLLAYALRDKITERSGYVLEAISAEERKDAEKGIFLGTEAPAQTGECAYLIPTEQGILLTAWDFFGISVAAERLCAQLFADLSQSECSWELSQAQTFVYEHRSHELLSFAAEGLTPFGSPNAVRQITDPILSHLPSAAFCGSVAEDQAQYLSQNLSGYDSLRHTGGCTAYGRDGALTRLTFAPIEGTELYASSFWVGDEWNGFSVIRIGGTLTEDCQLRLSELFDDLGDYPTVLLVHVEAKAGTLTLETDPSTGLSAILAESYAVAGTSYYWECHATVKNMTTQVTNGGSADLYRTVTVERTSAF